MRIDASLLEAQCAVLQQDVFSEEKFERMMKHPAMAAFLEHEKMLDRTTSESTVRSAFVMAGDSDCVGLLPRNIRELSKQLCAIADAISQSRNQFAELALERIRKFSDCKIGEDSIVYLYALGTDGGFCLREGELYINLLYTKDNWMDVLCHEMYHARTLNEECEKKRIAYLQLTEETDETGDMLLSELAEEGIATLIQHEGNGIPQKEGVCFFVNQLKNWKNMTAQERMVMYNALSSGPQGNRAIPMGRSGIFCRSAIRRGVHCTSGEFPAGLDRRTANGRPYIRILHSQGITASLRLRFLPYGCGS